MEKVKDVIPLETRISLFQTAMNNAGRNFEGKRVPVKRMAAFATDFYQLAITEVGQIGKIGIAQLEKMVAPKQVAVKSTKADVDRLLQRVHRKRNAVRRRNGGRR